VAGRSMPFTDSVDALLSPILNRDLDN
jgi:hypothetical protein